VAYPTVDQVRRVVEAARCLVAAHEDRNQDYRHATLNEVAALAILNHEIASLEREAAFPLSGMGS
jgi:hypothetical protein